MIKQDFYGFFQVVKLVTTLLSTESIITLNEQGLQYQNMH